MKELLHSTEQNHSFNFVATIQSAKPLYKSLPPQPQQTSMLSFQFRSQQNSHPKALWMPHKKCRVEEGYEQSADLRRGEAYAAEPICSVFEENSI